MLKTNSLKDYLDHATECVSCVLVNFFSHFSFASVVNQSIAFCGVSVIFIASVVNIFFSNGVDSLSFNFSMFMLTKEDLH